MDETQVHSALRNRCKALLAERGWRQIAVTREGPGEVSLALGRDPSTTGLTPEVLIVLIGTRVSDGLLRARMEIQSDLHLVGVITILDEALPTLLTHALRADELLSDHGRERLLQMAEELETWAHARGAPR